MIIRRDDVMPLVAMIPGLVPPLRAITRTGCASAHIASMMRGLFYALRFRCKRGGMPLARRCAAIADVPLLRLRRLCIYITGQPRVVTPRADSNSGGLFTLGTPAMPTSFTESAAFTFAMMPLASDIMLPLLRRILIYFAFIFSAGDAHFAFLAKDTMLRLRRAL